MIEKSQNLISTFQDSIFTRDYFCDFEKISKNTFDIKVQLNILNSLIGENNIEEKFLEVTREYPKVREVLPVLLATRKNKLKEFPIVVDKENMHKYYQEFLFDSKISLDKNNKQQLLEFFRQSGLKEVFENKYITNLNDYVFGVETGLDTNARKNRTGDIMEGLVETFLQNFCEKYNNYTYKEQATAKWISENWNIKVESDKSDRKFDFALFNKNSKKIYLIEVNYYGGGGSKLKSVAGEFTTLYRFLQNQNIPLIWITDGLGWNTARKPLEEAYYATNGNIYNLEMLKNGILDEIIE